MQEAWRQTRVQIDDLPKHQASDEDKKKKKQTEIQKDGEDDIHKNSPFYLILM